MNWLLAYEATKLGLITLMGGIAVWAVVLIAVFLVKEAAKSVAEMWTA